MNGKLTILVCILVAGVIVGASLPIFDSLTASSDSIHNEGAGWVRFDLNKSADASYNINVSWDDDGYYIANGSNVQTFNDSTTEDFSTIIYADSNVSVWTFDGDNILMLGTDDGAPVTATFTDPVSIARDSTGVVISDGTDSYTFGAPAWAYVPQSSGAYGFFSYDEERGVKNPTGTPTAVIGGGNVGVYAYNDIYTYAGLGLTMHPIIDAETGLYYGAEWYKDETPLNPDDLNITPINPGIVIPGGDSTQGASGSSNPDPGIIDIDDPFNPGDIVLAIPTPTYTEGNWGYDLSNVGGVQKAKIVSYSGTGGGAITVPATIGGYEVYMLGKDSSNANVFPTGTNLSATDLIISSGITKIGKYACANASGFTGSLTIPDTVTSIGDSAFNGCSNFTGDLTLSVNITSIGTSCFNQAGFTGGTLTVLNGQIYPDCFDNTKFNTAYLSDTVTFQNAGAGCFAGSRISSIRLPSNLTVIPANNFNSCTNLNEIVIPDTVTSIGSTAFSNCTHLTNVKMPSRLVSIGSSAFYSAGSSGVQPNTINEIVIPDTVTSIGSSAFQFFKAYKLIIASEAIPNNSTAFANSSDNYTLEVLDLSDTVDYSVDRYGLRTNNVVIYDSIGDCFGYIAVVDLEGEGNGTIGDLIALLPVIMLAGLVLFSIVALAINRS